MNPVVIRPISHEDLSQLASAYTQAINKLDVGEKWEDKSSYALLESWFKQQPDLAFCALYEAQLVGGFIVGIRPWWDGNHLVTGELFVQPDYQNRGIAKQLLKQTLNTAVEKYNPVIWETHTFRHQEFPLTWYKQLGFREINEWVMIQADVIELISKLN